MIEKTALPIQFSGIEGLTFRLYQGEQDLPGMFAVKCASDMADHDDFWETVENMRDNYRDMVRCDPFRDVILVEKEEQIIAYGRVTWRQVEDTKERIYFSFGHILPEWRGKGLGSAMMEYNEARLKEIAAGHPQEGERLFEVFMNNIQESYHHLAQKKGYQPVRYGFAMACNALDNIPDLPLPEGLEVRPVLPEHYRPIWDAMQEAFRDHWGFSQPEESEFEHWQQGMDFQPDLWQVAWDGDQVAGMVLNFIGKGNDGQISTTRGWTEGISVRRPWRRRGLARALLAHSMRMFRERGFVETALGVDGLNPNGALQLYESMGYTVERRQTTYRKPMK